MKSKSLMLLLIGAMLLCVACPSAFADNVYATIRGTATDATGAVSCFRE